MYGNLGNDFNKQQRYPEAVIAYQKAIELNPKDLTVYYNL
jgi:tetratricopeptide (TPR) repeat protein